MFVHKIKLREREREREREQQANKLSALTASQTLIKDSYYGRTDGRPLGLWDASRSPQLIKLV